MKYLTEWPTIANYEAIKDELNLPNVSLIDETSTLEYTPYVPDPTTGHAYVEINGMKWATMNIGANNITDVGLYFQWGDTQGYSSSQMGNEENQKTFEWDTYLYGDGTNSPDSSSLTKYNSTDELTNIELIDDAARINWGGDWRIPTKNEFQLLGESTNHEWVSNYQDSGINGVILTDKTDESKQIFIPSSGYALGTGIGALETSGNCWSSDIDPNNLCNAFRFHFRNDYFGFYEIDGRRIGFPIRAILNE